MSIGKEYIKISLLEDDVIFLHRWYQGINRKILQNSTEKWNWWVPHGHRTQDKYTKSTVFPYNSKEYINTEI